MVITSFIKSWWIVFKWVWEIKFPGVLGCFGFGKYLNGLKNKFKSLNYLWTLTPAKPCLPNDVGATNCGRGAEHVQIPGHGGKAEGVDVIDVGKTDTCHGWVVVLERKHVFFLSNAILIDSPPYRGVHSTAEICFIYRELFVFCSSFRRLPRILLLVFAYQVFT